MTTKQASTIVSSMKQGLTGNDLNAAVAAAMSKHFSKIEAGDPNFDKLAGQIRNEYVQHAWDVEEVVGPQASKKVAPAKKAAKKAAAPKKEKGPSRVARMFHHVLEGKSNEQALAAIKKEFGAKVPTNVASIGWCRSQLRAKTDYAAKYNPGHKVRVKSDRELTAKK